MGLGRTMVLGFIAGATILLGLPIGRLRRPAPTLRAVLNATAVGVLLFLVWDVLSHAWEPIDAALGALHDGGGSMSTVLGYGVLFVGGLAVGLLSLVAYEGWIGRLTARARLTPSADAVAGLRVEDAERRPTGIASWSVARRLALLIAVGIGLHNFAEGLAIGQSAARGEIALATLLVIGFALHNATEGFGITAPLAGDLGPDGAPRRPSWAFLLGLGLIGGGPTFVGAAVGHGYTSEPLSVVFLTLAAGSILYVVTQLLGVAARAKRPDLLAYGLLLGMVAGFATDAIVTAGGA
ncbi:ZIP family metal transporter [Intrasporangium sp. YIM S08009]|uniref:ZIP family metal transporter n=1 Tax=Intrasporangium zincisolvens TaxID=3080018 RepID=UPI002B0591CF|nr:ZIP family metal transporter [Intrasporangium sp. YIM S08009]